MIELDDLLGAVCGAASGIAVGTGSPAASSMAPRSAPGLSRRAWRVPACGARHAIPFRSVATGGAE